VNRGDYPWSLLRVVSLGERWRHRPRLGPDKLARSGATVNEAVDWGITFPDVASSTDTERLLVAGT